MKQFLIRIEHKTGVLAGAVELAWYNADAKFSIAELVTKEFPGALATLDLDNRGQLITRIV